MFKNIKKLSEYSVLSESPIYKIVGPGGKSHAEVPSEDAEKAGKAKDKLHEQMDALVMQHENQILRLLVEGAEYRSGDWRSLNEKFIKEFGKKGMTKEATIRLLKRFQTEAFEAYGLKGDRQAGIDGKLGPYTLYAFALYFNLRRPKVAVPMGCPRLAKVIGEDAEEAFKFYQEFPFAKNANIREFKKAYKNIKANTSVFNPDSKYAKLGDWALALWEGGYAGGKEKKIGFPSFHGVDTRKYPYADGMEIVMFIEGEKENPIFVDKKGKLYKEDIYEGGVEPYNYKGKKAKKPEPATPAKPPAAPKAPADPKPKPEQKPLEYDPDAPIARVRPGPVRRTLLEKHKSINKMKPEQVIANMEKAGFSEVEFEAPDHYIFKYRGMDGSLAIRSNKFFQFSVTRPSGTPLIWHGHPPKEFVGRDSYRAEDMPKIAKLVKEHLEEYKFGVKKALAACGVKRVEIKDYDMLGILAEDGVYYFKYKGHSVALTVLGHGTRKMISFSRKVGTNKTHTEMASGRSFDQAVGKMMEKLDKVKA